MSLKVVVFEVNNEVVNSGDNMGFDAELNWLHDSGIAALTTYDVPEEEEDGVIEVMDNLFRPSYIAIYSYGGVLTNVNTGTDFEKLKREMIQHATEQGFDEDDDFKIFDGSNINGGKILFSMGTYLEESEGELMI